MSNGVIGRKQIAGRRPTNREFADLVLHRSVHHQHGDRHRLEDGAGHAAEDLFSDSTMPIAADDQQVALPVGNLGQEQFADIPLPMGTDAEKH